jgi:hypothetical protein
MNTLLRWNPNNRQTARVESVPKFQSVMNRISYFSGAIARNQQNLFGGQANARSDRPALLIATLVGIALQERFTAALKETEFKRPT